MVCVNAVFMHCRTNPRSNAGASVSISTTHTLGSLIASDAVWINLVAAPVLDT